LRSQKNEKVYVVVKMSNSDFTYEKPNEEAFFDTLIKYLRMVGEQEIANILWGSKCRIQASGTFSRERWNAMWTAIHFYIPIGKLPLVNDDIAGKLIEICNEIMPVDVGFDVMEVEFSPLIPEHETQKVQVEAAKDVDKITLKKKTLTPFSKNVFIIHGRNVKPALELERLLRDFGLNPIILYKQPDKGRTIIEKLEDHSANIGYVFVILTSDDGAFNLEQLVEVVRKIEASRLDRKQKDKIFLDQFGTLTQKVARQNVILELGYFMGLLGRNRICCLYTGDVTLPSDIHGIVYKEFKESVKECLDAITKELKAAGYEIKV